MQTTEFAIRNNGVYELNDEFYKTSGGIFDPMPHYEEMFAKLFTFTIAFQNPGKTLTMEPGLKNVVNLPFGFTILNISLLANLFWIC
ncbi:MAG: hypothetical protein WCP85_31025 [Mariniphaga sp.]